MPRNTQNVYQAPPGTYGVSGQTISSVKYNAFVDDVVADLNAARPISAGGTGATNIAAARTNLSVPSIADLDALSNTVTGLGNTKLNLSGGTLTGALTGTTATFTGGVTANLTGNVTGNVTGNLTGDVTGDVTGNAGTATTLAATRTFGMTGVVTATAQNFNGSGNVTFTTTIANNALSIAKTSGLQAALDDKLNASNYTANDVLAKLLTVDGSSSGLDAQFLSGKPLSNFITKDGAATTGTDFDNHTSTDIVTLNNGSANQPQGGFNHTLFVIGGINANNLIQLDFPRGSTEAYFRSRSGSIWSSWSRFWNNNNHGAGSGLDADLLDGLQGSAYAKVTGGLGLRVENTNPTLILRDTDGTGNNHTGWVGFYDSADAQQAWIGFGSTGNDNLNLQNNYAGGLLTYNSQLIYHAGNFDPSTKAEASHTHSIANVVGLQSTLDAKLNLSGGNITGSLSVSQAEPSIQLIETDQGTSTNQSRFVMSGGDFFIQSEGPIRFTGFLGTDLTALTARFGGVNREIYHSGNIGGVANSTFSIAKTSGLQTALDGKLDDFTTGSLAFSTASGDTLLQSNSNGFIRIGPQNASFCHIYTDLPSFFMDKPLLIQGSTVYHSGNIGNVANNVFSIAKTSGLQTALNGKAATSHTHSISNVTGLQAALDAKEPALAADQKRKTTISSAAPSGGSDGDIWLQY